MLIADSKIAYMGIDPRSHNCPAHPYEGWLLLQEIRRPCSIKLQTAWYGKLPRVFHRSFLFS